MGQSTIAELQAELAALSEKLGPDTVVTYMLMPVKADALQLERDWRAAHGLRGLRKNKAEMTKVITRFCDKFEGELIRDTLQLVLEMRPLEPHQRADSAKWDELINRRNQIRSQFTERADLAYWTMCFNKISRLGNRMTVDDIKEVIEDVCFEMAA